MSWENVRTVGIIGAGISGIVTAKTLIADGFHCTVFERGGEIGGVWADGYLNFGVQVQKELYQFPDWPLPADAPDFTPGPEFRQYLEDYCAHFEVTPRIRFNSEVTRIEPRGDGNDGWSIIFRDSGGQHRKSFDLVVICIGTFSDRPNLPTFTGQDRFQGEVIHNSKLKSAEQLTNRKVVVLGYGKSATDAAIESARAARHTTLVAREPRWPIPRRLAGVLPFKWGLLHRMTGALLPLYQQPTGVERVLHKAGAPVVWLYWRLTELLLIAQLRLSGAGGRRTSLVPSMPIELSGFDHTTMVPQPELYRLIREGEIDVHRDFIDGFTGQGVTLGDGTEIDADLVILATGWRTDYSFLGNDIDKLNIEDDGFYLYRHMICPDLPNLVFLGCNAFTFEAIVTFNVQARWLAELLKGRHHLPSGEAMIRNVEQMKLWKRSWMLDNPGRAAMIGPHQIHYHDELLRDFGANPKRKTGILAPLKELLSPYESGDYAAIASGDWELENPLPG